MQFTPSTEIVKTPGVIAPQRKTHGLRALAAAALATIFTATFAVPAYAQDATVDPVAFAVRTGNLQGFTAAEGVITQPQVSQQAEKIVVVEAAAPATTQGGTPQAAVRREIPAVSYGASGLIAAARAQLGISQDCTDLVQNSLAAMGLTKRRDQGGYDHGVWDFQRYGVQVSAADAQPGDIMISGGHVTIYTGGGSAVHGGWTGFTTVETSGRLSQPGAYSVIIRLP